jgi:hypothetical protein
MQVGARRGTIGSYASSYPTLVTHGISSSNCVEIRAIFPIRNFHPDRGGVILALGPYRPNRIQTLGDVRNLLSHERVVMLEQVPTLGQLDYFNQLCKGTTRFL